MCSPSSHESDLLCDNHRKAVLSREAFREEGWGQRPRGLPFLKQGAPTHVREARVSVPAAGGVCKLTPGPLPVGDEVWEAR